MLLPRTVRIGLIGPPRAGKDMVADWLVEQKEFRRFAFADKIKQEYFAEIGITPEEFEGAKGTERGGRLRDGLWAYSDRMRELNGTFHFIDMVLSDVRSSMRNAVITDIRTKAELTTAHIDLRATIVLVTRGSDPPAEGEEIPASRLRSADLPQEMLHFRNDFDTIQEAHGALEDFYRRIKNAV